MKTAKPERHIEEQVADTILEKPVAQVKLGEQTYLIAPPTLGTLILISKYAQQLPPAPADNEELNILKEVLTNAKDCKVIGKIIATLILGAKRVLEYHKVPIQVTIQEKQPRRFWQKRKEQTKTIYIPEIDYIKDLVLDELSPKEANELVAKTLMELQLPDFFGLTTSLTTANHLKPTREVENPIQSGD